MTSNSSDEQNIPLTCLDNTTRRLPAEQTPRGTSPKSTYPLTVGRTYPVVGMASWENVLLALTPDDTGMPSWAPFALFDVGVWRMPPHWYFRIHTGVRATGRHLWATPLVALWGYQQLVEDLDHLNGLAELEPSDLAIFNDQLAGTR